MTTIENIDLSDMIAATLSFSYGIDNADAGEFMAVSISGDGGTSFIDVGFFEGTQSGSWRVNIVDFVPLSSQIKLRASCLTNQNMERCSWDDITVETVGRSSGPLLMTILSPRAGTYGPSDFPLPFSVALNDFGSVDYSLDGAAPEAMTGDNGASSTTFTALQGSLGSGNHGFEAFATDTQGNTTSDSIAFAVDLDTPAVAFADPTPADGSSQSAAAVDIRLATNSGLDHYSFVEMDEDLYLWLRMDDVIGGTVTDLSAHGNHGTIQGDAVENPDGRFGVAFEFDGIDHGGTIISDRILIDGFQDRHNIFDTSFTVMAWAKPDVSDKMVIIGNKSITALPGWHLRTSSGNHKLRIGVNSGDTSATAASAQASDPMVPGAWVHVVGIYDHTVPHIQLNLDGVLVATKANNVSPLGYGNDLELAVGMPEDPRKTWDGLIDEVLIFNRVLSASEIKALYSSSADQYQNTYSGLGAGIVHGYTGYSVNSLGILDQTETRSLAIE